jgi:hypothetical protein
MPGGAQPGMITQDDGKGAQGNERTITRAAERIREVILRVDVLTTLAYDDRHRNRNQTHAQWGARQ